MAGAIPVVKGYALRATKVDACGKPIEGPRNRIVTKGFIEFTPEPELKQREELEQLNAEGKVCFADTTAPEIKRHNLSLQLCGVDAELSVLFNSLNEKVLDYDDNVVGLAVGREVDTDYGVALEIWTGGSSEDDCLDNPADSIFSVQGSGKTYGYLLMFGKEWVTGNFPVTAGITNMTLSGISIPGPHWGRGPYNVAAIDGSGTPGRLLVPVLKKREFTFFRTTVEPPMETDGACELAVQSIFDTGDYFGAEAVDVAPDQPICNGVGYTVVNDATSGNFTLLVGTDETADIAFDALPAAVQSAVEALSSVEVGQVQVSGTAGDYVVTLDPSLGVLTADSSGLTGGTAVVTAL
ncbi:Uncharacterised protein [Mycolicibacterium vanbaalenii]|uniref:Major tail protein n=1 Tax=Mycolicibacterium vanbaalenii TaxID=110539 RepID=A0A5S9R9W3_MYCVN|nr:hypothetical protein [Mycolicibacterium vanbaalenii]CAA0134547.1 Uncharacterised protein [Mycolicibacterium vanbaalenii]